MSGRARTNTDGVDVLTTCDVRLSTAAMATSRHRDLRSPSKLRGVMPSETRRPDELAMV